MASQKKADGARNTAPVRLKLLFTVVKRPKAELYMDLLQPYQVNFQLSTVAFGTASAEMLRYLGVPDSENVLLCSVIRADAEKAILSMLEEKFRTVKNGKGIAFTVPMTSVIGVAIYQFLSSQPSEKEGHL